MIKLSEILKSNAVLPLSKELNLNLMCTNSYVTDHYHTFFKSYNLTPQQYNVLRILKGQNTNPANLSTLQERMIHKSSNVTRIVDKLLNKQLVIRQTCKNNRRKIELLITDKGIDLLHQIDPKLDELEDFLTSPLSENEMSILSNLLEKLRQ